jgi:hypothetical protein
MSSNREMHIRLLARAPVQSDMLGRLLSISKNSHAAG